MRYFVILLTASVGCSTSSQVTVPPLLAAGQSCGVDNQCATGLVCGTWGLPSNACAQSCAQDSDCPSGDICTTIPDSTKSYCVPPCNSLTSLTEGVCVNGVPTSCEKITPGSYCKECSFETPCPQGTRCDTASDECVELPGLGAPCTKDSDCMSNNCGVPASAPAGTTATQCLVAPGAACTPQNCGSCDTVAGGAGCAQSCTQDTDCPVLDDDGTCHPFPQVSFGQRYWPCLGTPTGGYYCRQPCDGVSSECPPGLSCAAYTPGQCSDYLFNDACQ